VEVSFFAIMATILDKIQAIEVGRLRCLHVFPCLAVVVVVVVVGGWFFFGFIWTVCSCFSFSFSFSVLG
jgi:hypothetical protein